MRHVVPLVGENGDDPLVIDASFSQFLGYVGISGGYEEQTKEQVFPEEKVIDFVLSEREMVVNWLTSVATQFHSRNRHPYNEFGWDLGSDPLSAAPKSTIQQNFAKIWNPTNFLPWESIPRVQQDGQEVAKYIPREAISIV